MSRVGLLHHTFADCLNVPVSCESEPPQPCTQFYMGQDRNLILTTNKQVANNYFPNTSPMATKIAAKKY